MTSELLTDFWYVAAPSSALGRGAMQPVSLLGEQVLLLRSSEGAVSALKDFCPHRGVPLRYGRFDGREVECCYHGWKFGCDGGCTDIPTLLPEERGTISRIKAGTYPCREEAGLIWVYVTAAGTRAPEMLPPLPALPGAAEKKFLHITSMEFPCDIDHAAIGLMDPSHGPFVHASWWWRSARSMHTKQKQFVPSELGFTMASHAPSSNSRAYKILGGGERKTEISFRLPGLRTEHIVVGGREIVLLTALTPIDGARTLLHQFMYTDIGLLNLLRPLLLPFGKAFIRQDLEIVRKQQEGLTEGHPPLLLLGDADQQALWYYKLKKHWLEARARGAAFENPLKEKLLKWRS